MHVGEQIACSKSYRAACSRGHGSTLIDSCAAAAVTGEQRGGVERVTVRGAPRTGRTRTLCSLGARERFGPNRLIFDDFTPPGPQFFLRLRRAQRASPWGTVFLIWHAFQTLIGILSHKVRSHACAHMAMASPVRHSDSHRRTKHASH